MAGNCCKTTVLCFDYMTLGCVGSIWSKKKRSLNLLPPASQSGRMDKESGSQPDMARSYKKGVAYGYALCPLSLTLSC
jgi:hypothetical protein